MASSIEKFLFKLRGVQDWQWADANVFNYVLGTPGRNGQCRAELSYSFWLGGHIYSGIARWDEVNAETSYRNGDIIQVQYNPADPNQSYFPEHEDLTTTFYLVIIAAVLLLVILTWWGLNLIRHL